MSGQSNPSENTSTFTMMSISLFLNLFTKSFLSFAGVLLSILTALNPASWYSWQMCLLFHRRFFILSKPVNLYFIYRFLYKTFISKREILIS